MSDPIVPAKTAISTFRDAGYKNTASAIAELIDNSIEAEAKEIQILAFQEYVNHGERSVLRVTKIAIYDNGCGMSPETLCVCLQFGNGTRLDSREGIGRFGIGLPNASISQCKRVDVYSWQGKECHRTYLDVDEVIDKEQQNVNPVTPCDIPSELVGEIDGRIGQSGTFIVWSNCDRIDVARSKTLYNRMSRDLCRSYRHYLDSDNDYGDKRAIKMIICGDDREVLPLCSNDPLYILTPNNVPGYEGDSTNEPYGEPIIVPIQYGFGGDISNVEIRFSIAKPETQALGGASKVGRHYRENTGISFVRAGRQIDFGTFGYFNDRDERERWWGCEIRFTPVLDELFGVTHTKQSVRGINFLDEDEFRKENPDDYDDILEHDFRTKMRIELSRRFTHFHRDAMKTIISRGAGTRGETAFERAGPDASTRIANEQLRDAKAHTRSAAEGAQKTDRQKKGEWKERLLEADETLTTGEAETIAGDKIPLKIEKDFRSWPGTQFFTVEITGATAVVVINRGHPFFTEMYERLMQAEDQKEVDSLDLLLMAYARMEDELYSKIDDLDEIREHWGRHVKSFLKELSSSA